MTKKTARLTTGAKQQLTGSVSPVTTCMKKALSTARGVIESSVSYPAVSVKTGGASWLPVFLVFAAKRVSSDCYN